MFNRPGNIGCTPEDVQHALNDSRPWTMVEYQSLATRTLNNGLTQKEGIMHAGALVASDGGELCGAAKAHFFYGKELTAIHDKVTGQTLEQNLIEEAGDALWGIAEIATRLGITLEDIGRYNMKKLLKRYPEKYFAQAAIARADKDAVGDGRSIDEIANGHAALR